MPGVAGFYRRFGLAPRTIIYSLNTDRAVSRPHRSGPSLFDFRRSFTVRCSARGPRRRGPFHDQ